MQLDPFAGLPFHLALASFRTRYNITQAQCASLIPHLSVRSLQQWECGARVPPLWSQRLILDALMFSDFCYYANDTSDETNTK
jgi:hypothetical protein